MDYCGIGSAVAFSNLTEASGFDANSAVLRAINGNPRFLPAFVLTPRAYDEQPGPDDYADAMRHAGAKVAWLRPAWHGYSVGTWLLGDLLEMCVARRLPLFLPVDGVPPNDIREVCAAFPSLRLVLAHIGYRSDVWLYPLLRKHRELRICLGHTYCPTLAPERFVRHFGPERIIFGSGLPQFAPGGLIAMVAYARLSDEARQKILAGNIEQLMSEVCG